jgi:hypothetical protein
MPRAGTVNGDGRDADQPGADFTRRISCAEGGTGSVNTGDQPGGLIAVGGVFGEGFGEDRLFVVYAPQLEGDLHGENRAAEPNVPLAARRASRSLVASRS